MENTEIKDVSKNIIWVSSANIMGRILTFISSIIIARILYPEDFGIISMAATFSGFIDIFSRLGLEAYIVSRQDISKQGVNSVYILSVIIGAVFGGLMMLSGPIAALIYKTPEVRLILLFTGLSFFVNSFAGVPKALLNKEMKQYIISRVDILQNFLNVILILTFAFAGFRYLSFVIPYFITNIIVCLIYLSITKWKFEFSFEKPAIKNALIYGKSFMPKTFLAYFVYCSDYVFVGYLLGSKVLGYYFFGFDKSAIIVVLMSNIVCSVFFPMFAKIQNSNDQLKNLLYSVISKQSFIAYPLIFIQIFLATELIRVVYGHRWDNSIFTFQLILGYSFFRIVVNIIHVLFDAVGKPEYNLKYFLIAAPVCITTFIAGTKFGGLAGISIAAFLTHTSLSMFLFYLTCRFFRWSYKEMLLLIFKGFIPILVQFPVIVVLKYYLHIIKLPDYLVLIIEGISFAILYMVFAKIFLKDTYNSLMRMVKEKILNKINLKDSSYEKA